jgi:hypothetical protein
MLHQPRQQFIEEVIRHFARLCDSQLRMRLAGGRLVVGKQLLIQLLARPQAREHDPDLLLREPIQTDQIARQIHDPHRLTHIQDKDLAATPTSAPKVR